ncbi:hypothetical protein ACHAPI_004016 [Fusarium lateritium]
MAGQYSVVKQLILADADVEAVEYDRSTSLHLASRFNHAEVVQLLIGADANINIAGLDGYTALYYAVLNNHVEVGRLLDEAGADVNIVDIHGNTALMEACEEGNVRFVDMLLHHNARLDIEDENGLTALMKAMVYSDEYLKIFAQLSRADSTQKSPYLKPSYFGAALLKACKERRKPRIKVLLENGAMNSPEAHNGLPFLVTLEDYEYDDRHEWKKALKRSIIQLLLHFGVDVAHCNEETTRELMVQASRNQNEGLVRWLIQQGLSVHGADKHHVTPLAAALKMRNKAITRLLRAEGARITKHLATG